MIRDAGRRRSGERTEVRCALCIRYAQYNAIYHHLLQVSSLEPCYARIGSIKASITHQSGLLLKPTASLGDMLLEHLDADLLAVVYLSCVQSQTLYQLYPVLSAVWLVSYYVSCYSI